MTSIPLKDGRTMVIDSLFNHQEFIPVISSKVFSEWPEAAVILGIPNEQALLESYMRETDPEGVNWHLIGICDGKLVGWAGLSDSDWPDDARMPWLVDVYLFEEFRGLGASLPIIKAVMQHALKIGYKIMYLWCEPKNEQLYPKLGFKKVEKKEFPCPDGTSFPTIIMDVDLTKM